jgi:hypothetical protein
MVETDSLCETTHDIIRVLRYQLSPAFGFRRKHWLCLLEHAFLQSRKVPLALRRLFSQLALQILEQIPSESHEPTPSFPMGIDTDLIEAIYLENAGYYAVNLNNNTNNNNNANKTSQKFVNHDDGYLLLFWLSIFLFLLWNSTSEEENPML